MADRDPTLQQSLEDSLFSHSFRLLRFMGAWVVDPSNPVKLAAYSTYKLIMTIMSVLGLLGLFADLYMVLGDFRKMTWNLCITALFFGSLSKNIYTVHTNRKINGLRMKLHRDAMSRNTPADEVIHKEALKELKMLMITFYGTMFVFIPLWLVTRWLSYLWGPRELPMPMRVPFDIDNEDGFQYNLAFFIYGCGGITGALLVAWTEISMFAILIQISREYRVLFKDISMLDEVYENVYSKQEVNPWLRRLKTKIMLRKCSIRQQTLIEYIKEFELSYSFTLLLQVFIFSLLVIVSAMQCILESDNISMNLSYQMGYTFILVVDMFLVCWFSTRIRGQCMKVGEAAYSVHWYGMTTDIQRDIRMMIMRAQRPPKITAGKVLELNLHAFMLMLRNIYSWLTLFQQLEFKTH